MEKGPIIEQEEVEMMSSLVKIGRWLIRIHDGLSKMLFYAAGVLLFFMALAISYEVTMRYFFNEPTVWVMDFSEYALIYSTFMAAPWLLKAGWSRECERSGGRSPGASA